jgi:hypothetical protein
MVWYLIFTNLPYHRYGTAHRREIYLVFPELSSAFLVFLKISKNTRHHWDDVRKIRITSATESHRILITTFSSEDIDKRETDRLPAEEGQRIQ